MNALRSIYSMLLQAYPMAFKDRFRTEMLLAFDDILRDSGHGPRTLLAFIGLMSEGVLSLFREWWAEAGLETKIGFPLALAGCIVIAQCERHSTDVQGPLFVLLAFAFALGAAMPARAWIWGVVFGLAIPVSHLALTIAQHPPAEPIGVAGVVLIIPGMIGAYCGVLGRAIATLPVVAEPAAGNVVSAVGLFAGLLIGMADFTLITPIPALVSVALCATVLGRFNAKPWKPVMFLGAGVPVAIVILMAMHGTPTRHHYVLVDGRAIGIAFLCAGLAWNIQRNQGRGPEIREPV